MESRKLYESDSHCRVFEAVVLGCDLAGECYQIVLDQTAFFPEGGGQAADTGFLNESPVLDVQIKDGIVYHKTKNPFGIGEKVEGAIDWNERLSNMQQHSGEHIVSGLVYKLHGFDNVGFHMGSEAITMDFNGLLTLEDLLCIEVLANEAVVKNIEVKTGYPSKEELASLTYRSKLSLESGVRIVTIDGYDICACCAPHVKRTGEIGLIKILGVQKYKGGCRVSMLCGFRALADYNQKLASVTKISVELSAKQESIAEAVKKCKEENGSLRGKVSTLLENRIKYLAQEHPEEERLACFYEEDFSGNELRKLANAVVEKTGGTCAVFSPTGQDLKVQYCIISKNRDAAAIANVFNASLQGKGGGNKEQAQGSLYAAKSRIEEVWSVFGKEV